jgi:hypothetical protein
MVDDAVDPTLPSVGLLKLVLGWIQKFTLDPQIRFGSPQQRATETWRVWWHVPITLKRRWWSWRESIPRCIVQLIPPDREPEKPMNLRWQHRDSATGTSEITLDCGRLKLIPIAIRDEAQVGEVRVRPQFTGESYLRDGLHKFVIRPGDAHRFRLRVVSGSRSWTSPHVYKISGLGHDASNGHFVLEIETQDPY